MRIIDSNLKKKIVQMNVVSEHIHSFTMLQSNSWMSYSFTQKQLATHLLWHNFKLCKFVIILYVILDAYKKVKINEEYYFFQKIWSSELRTPYTLKLLNQPQQTICREPYRWEFGYFQYQISMLILLRTKFLPRSLRKLPKIVKHLTRSR